MKIIHLSDLHVGQKHRADDFRKIVKYLNTEPDFGDGKHIVVISGDLIEDAGKKDPFAGVKEILGELSPRFKGRIFLCPGNHDYGDFWGGHKKFIKRFRQEFSDYIEGSGTIPRNEYEALGLPHSESPFPVVDIIDDLALIGLDSTAEELQGGHDLGAEGNIGERQRASLYRLLNHDGLKNMKVVVYLHHHPFKMVHYANRLRDADDFVNVVNGRIDALLFGHNHHYENCSGYSQEFGVPLALEGGKSTRDMRFRVIDAADRFRYREYQVPGL